VFSYPLREKLPHFISITRNNNPIGIYLLLWPTLWGLWFASDGFPKISLLLIFILGTILTRSAGCIVNDYADRSLDGHVARTQHRPLATGALSSKEALIAAALLSLLAFGLVLLTNTYTVLMSFVALGLAVLYPFTKRFTHWPQAFLGLAFAFGVPMAFTATTNSLPPLAWAIYLAVIILAIAYDTYYAMADREFDIKMNMKSTAILFGNYDRVIIVCLQLLVFLIMAGVGISADRSAAYFAGLFAALGFVVYQYKITATRDPKACVQAFFNHHYMCLTILCGLALDYALFPSNAL